jgi:hypothetical protein
MPFLRDNPRKLKSATEIDTINRVLQKYVDFKDLYIHLEFKAKPVEFLDHPDTDTLLLHFDESLEEERIEIFTVVRERFIDFDLEKISPAGGQYPENSYLMRILNCSIALDKREHERITFADELPAVTNIATIKVRERESDFRKSLSVKMIAEEFAGKMEGFDHKKIVFKDDADIPPAVQFVMESERNLHIEDTADPSRFFSDNEDFFTGTNSSALREELRLWLQNNSANIKSILVMPVQYFPLVGEPFSIGYLVVSNKDSVIEAGRIQDVNSFIEELSERIRNGNLVESKSAGKIMDVSAGGAMIEIADSKLVEKLVAQNIVVFEMNFKENNPLLISGKIVYVYRRDGGPCLMGVDFRGSRFGPEIKSVLPIHVKHYLVKRKQ